MNYKKSKYNYFVPYSDGQTIIYNFLSNFTGLLDKDTLDRYNTDTLSEDEQKQLYDRGFLIDVDYDELQKINSDRQRENNRDDIKVIRLWTTSACNARCFYCFEKGLPVETLDEEKCQKVLDYLKPTINENDNVIIEWFGGEPLINTKAIDIITKEMIEHCNKVGAKYSAKIISNGSLLNEELIDKMINDWKIRHIQITLDGDEKTYNQIKDYKNTSKDNFQSVFNNILLLKDRKNINVAIRLNYTRDNYESLITLLNDIGPKLQGSKNVIAYVYPIWSTLNKDEEDKFISDVYSDNNLIDIFDTIIKYGLNKPKKIIRINYKSFSCRSCNKNSFTILPSGNISKCSESFNTVYGNIDDGIVNNGYSSWSDFTIDDECTDCIYLPICQGGCEASKHSDMPKCFAFKPIIDDMLKWYVGKLLQK